MFHQLLKKTLINPKIIIEIGAHNGKDTKMLYENFPNANIHSFEANKKIYDKYLTTLINDKVKILNKAVCEINGKKTFYVTNNLLGDGGASSLLQSTDSYLKTYIKREDTVEVDAIRLEDYMIENNIEKVDLMWMDIEGYEYYVLKDSKNILKNFKYIYLEVNFQEFRKNTVLFDKLHKFMIDNNFSIKYKESQGTKIWGKWQGNVLYKNNTM